MNDAQVRRHLMDIEAAKHDDESAHALEDGLYVAVLRAIANGVASPDAPTLARRALEAQRISFSRWSA